MKKLEYRLVAINDKNEENILHQVDMETILHSIAIEMLKKAMSLIETLNLEKTMANNYSTKLGTHPLMDQGIAEESVKHDINQQHLKCIR